MDSQLQSKVFAAFEMFFKGTDGSEMITLFLQIILILSTIGVGLYLRTYVKSKAENLAQKEDLGPITRSVELIKLEFGIKNEEIKAELNILSSSKLDHKRYSRDAIIKMIEYLNDWYHISLDIGDVTFYKEGDDVRQKIIRIKSITNLSSKQASMLSLIINDGEYIEHLYKSISSIMTYSHFVENYLHKMSHLMRMQEKLVRESPNLDSMSGDEKNNYIASYDRFNSSLKSDRSNFTNEVRPIMAEASGALNVITVLSKSKIEALIG